MNAVIDTNVLISGLMTESGPPRGILIAFESGQFGWLASQEILDEYRRVVTYPKVRKYSRLSDDQVERLLDTLWVSTTRIPPSPGFPAVAADPDDDKFLACTLAGEADVIVSGDKHLLTLGEYAGIPILSPAAFLARLDETNSTTPPT